MDVDEFEVYRARAFSAGASYRTHSLPNTPRVRRYAPLPGMGSPIHSSVHEETSFDEVLEQMQQIDLEETKEEVPVFLGEGNHGGSYQSMDTTERMDGVGCLATETITHKPLTRYYSNPTPTNTPGTPPKTSHTRSLSCRRPLRPRDLDLLSTGRPRTCSMPTRNHFKKPNLTELRQRLHSDQDSEDSPGNCMYRVRSFSTTSKGIINRGDSFKLKKSTSQASLDSTGSCPGMGRGMQRTSSMQSQGSSAHSNSSSFDLDPPVYRVLMLGAQGVGKTALTQQFMTSDYMGHVEASAAEDDDELMEKTVSVQLDGDESVVCFTEVSGEDDTWQEFTNYGCVDAYILVYSVADRESFNDIVDVLHELRKDPECHAAIILVANKGDIVRNREITEDEGKTMAIRYDCKYIEVSAVLNHHIDELLVGVLRQISLKERKPKKRTKCLPDDNGCVQEAARGIIGKIFRQNPGFHSCDNLMVL